MMEIYFRVMIIKYMHNVHFKLNIPHACITMLSGISCLILIYKYSLDVTFK